MRLLYAKPSLGAESFEEGELVVVTKQRIEQELAKIPDPELGVSIYDLGLIYDIVIKGTKVKIVLTLTTIGCPLFSLIAEPIKEKLLRLEGVEDVEVELTFDPPWGPERMSRKAQMELGLD